MQGYEARGELEERADPIYGPSSQVPQLWFYCTVLQTGHSMEISCWKTTSQIPGNSSWMRGAVCWQTHQRDMYTSAEVGKRVIMGLSEMEDCELGLEHEDVVH